MATELNQDSIRDVSDSELLAVAEEIIQSEIRKSKDSGLEGKADDALGETQGKMSEEGQGSTGSAPQEANEKNKKTKDGADIMGSDKMNKSQADIEGSETGGLAPSVQGDHAAEEKGNGSIGGSEMEANPNSRIRGDASLSGAGASDTGQKPYSESDNSKQQNKNKKKDGTQEGDSQDEANDDSKLQADKALGGESQAFPKGGSSESHATQSGESQDEANKNSKKPGEGDNMSKSKDVAALMNLVRDLSSKVKTLEKSLRETTEKEPMKKSAIHADVLEKLSKSYIAQIEAAKSEKEELKKSFEDKFEKLQKSHDEMAKAIKKPAYTRQSLAGVEEIKKGEDQPQRMFKSKGDVLRRLEELRKSGKVSGDDVISFNASGNLSEDARRALYE